MGVPHPSPLLSERLPLIFMSTEVALGGNFVWSNSELPNESGVDMRRGWNLILNNNGSTGLLRDMQPVWLAHMKLFSSGPDGLGKYHSHLSLSRSHLHFQWTETGGGFRALPILHSSFCSIKTQLFSFSSKFKACQYLRATLSTTKKSSSELAVCYSVNSNSSVYSKFIVFRARSIHSH